VVLKCYDWAIEQREAGRCIISGFHSKIEKDVLHYLLQGKQPLIIALARGLKEKIEPEFAAAINNNRLLLITPFRKDVQRVTAQTAEKRNRMMIDLADEIVVGFISKGGSSEKLLSSFESRKNITKL
jgi:predicted Rossmann fold nucleotide-binding protein DprA/Smf involved in DNA uptake